MCTKKVLVVTDNETAIEYTQKVKVEIDMIDGDIYKKVFKRKKIIRAKIICKWISSHQEKEKNMNY